MSTENQRDSWPASDYVSRPTLDLLQCGHGAPPKVAWRRKLNSHANFLTEFNVTLKEAVKMIKLGIRLWSYIQAERAQGRTAPIDPFTRQIRASACHGVPLGGMGSGCIGRGFRGEFRRWQLMPGVCEEAPVLANQFSVFISRDQGEKFSTVLYPGRPPELGLSDENSITSWDWNLDGEKSSYHAVFPRAWTIYDGEPDPEIQISCRQISPFIPNNYKESCLPVTVFSYTVVNTGISNANVSLAFTWANSVGGSSHLSGGHFNECFTEDDGISGVLLHHKTAKGQPPISYAIAAQNTDEVNVSVFPCFSISGKHEEFSAKDMWMEIKEHGKFHEKHWDSFPTAVSLPGGAIGGAVAASVLLKPNEQKTINFCLVWDSPKVTFLKGRSYYRRYTKFYGFSGKAATRLAHDALLEFPRWDSEICSWQDPILENENLPEWYRFTLFNELYFLVAGGTIWTESEAANANREHLRRNQIMKFANDVPVKYSSDTNGDSTHAMKFVPDSADSRAMTSCTDREIGSESGKYTEIDNQALSSGINTEINSQAMGSGTDTEIDNHALSSGINTEINSQAMGSGTDTEIGRQEISFLTNTEIDSQSIKTGSNIGCDISRNGPHVESDHADVSLEPNSINHSEIRTLGDSDENIEMRDSSLMNSDCTSEVSEQDVGRFLYLEGLEYVMWCTYDVHFYASFALLELFPKLELAIQKEFATATLRHDPEKTKFLTEADWGVRKVVGAVPHDLGMHDPWFEVNAYNIHDTSKWKDLNCKFVLQVYRDFVATGDVVFAEKVWPAVFAAMAYMDRFDKDRDGLIENDGFPDQTYDTWTVHGISAYCGGLWLAALQAAAAMAEQLQHFEIAESFNSKFDQAKDVYERKLWNGSYFNYDSGTSSNSNSIQADQMAGQLYAYASRLLPLFETDKIRSSLRKIYEFNVLKIKGGKLGAVNGMHPDGTVDETCMQSREIWTGVTYALAATMVHAGMLKEAFHTAEGIFRAGWSEEGYGYWFQTPEGWTVNGHYRSLAYMRPLAIWAIQHALQIRNVC